MKESVREGRVPCVRRAHTISQIKLKIRMLLSWLRTRTACMYQYTKLNTNNNNNKKMQSHSVMSCVPTSNVCCASISVPHKASHQLKGLKGYSPLFNFNNFSFLYFQLQSRAEHAAFGLKHTKKFFFLLIGLIEGVGEGGATTAP